jgi:N-methylhydantoinase B/oxoprolinase/acetone carboxylase alpha subunit
VSDSREQTIERGQTVSRSELDPITLSVLGGGFKAIAKQMAQVLYRMSYSSIIRESEDLGCGIFFPDGAELCESDTTPMHVGSIPGYLEGIISVVGDGIHDGDVFLHNDPYRGASHTPDLCVALPIFHEGRLCAWACANGHVADVGGMSPGLMVHPVDVWAEGHHYSGLRIESRGIRNDELWRHIWENTRTPTLNRGDTEALISASRLGRARFLELIDKYGFDTVFAAAEYWLDYSERMIRREIGKAPDGVYRAPTQWLDDDGEHFGKPLRVEVAIEIDRDRLRVDLTGSNDQVPTGYNCPFSGSTQVIAFSVVRSILLDEVTTTTVIPQNSGIFRAIEVIAPKGSIFNPEFPAACTARINQVAKMADSMNLALAVVFPDRICAGSAGHTFFVSYSGLVEGRNEYWVYIEVNETSYGGRSGKDGLDAVDCLVANTRNNPVEELELRNPMRCLQYELRPGPGAGKWRGGMGVIRTWECLTDTLFSGEGDGSTGVSPPRGLFGGHDGVPGEIVVHPGREDERRIPGKSTNYQLRAGDVISLRTANSAGYGDPRERDPQLVLRDVLDELVSFDDSADVYGVIVDLERQSVDEEATARLRAP